MAFLFENVPRKFHTVWPYLCTIYIQLYICICLYIYILFMYGRCFVWETIDISNLQRLCQSCNMKKNGLWTFQAPFSQPKASSLLIATVFKLQRRGFWARLEGFQLDRDWPLYIQLPDGLYIFRKIEHDQKLTCTCAAWTAEATPENHSGAVHNGITLKLFCDFLELLLINLAVFFICVHYGWMFVSCSDEVSFSFCPLGLRLFGA